MRIMLVVTLAASLCACSETVEVKMCEEHLKSKLKAPSSYKRVKVEITDINPQHPENLTNPTQRWVSIDYDAVNSFNAPLRDHGICRFTKPSWPDQPTLIDDDLSETVEPENLISEDTAPAN